MKNDLVQSPSPPRYALVIWVRHRCRNQLTEGFVVLSVLQVQAPGCAIAAVLGQDSQLHRQRSRVLGAGDYAEKPCASQTLLENMQLAPDEAICAGSAWVISMIATFCYLARTDALIAPISYPVLIEGESGAGIWTIYRLPAAYTN